MVLAIDGVYVAKDITELAPKRAKDQWQTSRNPVNMRANLDLWHQLLKEIKHCAENGVEVSFCKISKNANKETAILFKQAAKEMTAAEAFKKGTGTVQMA